MTIERNDFDKRLIIVPDDPDEGGRIEVGQPEPKDYDDYPGAVATLFSDCNSDEGWILGREDARAIVNAILYQIDQHDHE